jgi:hypothetical protein
LDDVYICNRYFDLVHLFCSSFPESGLTPYNVHFSLGGYPLHADRFLSDVAFSDTLVLDVHIIRINVWPLIFSDLEGHQVGYLANLTQTPHITFSHYRGRFQDDPLTFCFEYDGQELPPSTRIDSIFWDPNLPICLIFRAPTVFVQFEELPNHNFHPQVDRNTTGELLCQLIHDHDPMFKSFELFCRDRQLKAKDKLIDLNPDLEYPVIVRNMRLHPALALLYVTSSGSAVLPLNSLKVRVADLKQFLHVLYPSDGKEIIVTHSGKTFRDNDELDVTRIYRVSFLRNTARFKLQFCPSGVRVEDAKICRDIDCNLKDLEIVGDLSRVFQNSGKFPRRIEFSFFNTTGACIDNVAMLTLADDTLLTVRYAPPCDPTTQQFVWEPQSDSSVVLSIGREETVRDVKRRLLYEFGLYRSLPGLFSLAFFDCPLEHADKFCDYGIPENSVIDITDIPTRYQQIRVQYRSTITSIGFTDLDTISDVELSFRRMNGDQCRDFAIFGESGRLSDDFRLIDLNRPELNVLEVLRFESATQTVGVPLPADATVYSAREALASHLGIESSLLRLLSGDSPLTDLSISIWSIDHPIHFSIAGVSHTFLFGDRRIELTVDVTVPIGAIESTVCLGFDISPPISFFLCGAELDADTPLSEFEITTDDVIEVRVRAAAPVLEPFVISLFRAVVPRRGTYDLAPSATLAEVEVRMQQRYKLGDLELAFYLWDAATDDQELIPKSTAVGSIDVGSRAPIARPSANVARAMDKQQSRFEALHASCGSSAASSPGYAFACDNPPDAFVLKLAVSAKVEDARVEVAKRFKRPPEAIALHFMGKALKDAFVMERLRLGTATINVHLLDDGG